MIRGMTAKSKVIGFIKDRFFLRFHMSLILMGTFLSGLLVTKVLLHIKLNNMFIRYPIAVVFSYLAFIVFVKIWLWYVKKNQSLDVSELIDIPTNITDSSVCTNEVLSDCGGGFGGGGASGSFDGTDNADGVVFSEDTGLGHKTSALHELVSSSNNDTDLIEGATEICGTDVSCIEEGSSAAGEVAGSVLEEGGVILMVLGVVLAAIFGASAYLVYEAPVILSEAAFDFLLASCLIRGAKKLEKPDWMGGVIRATWLAFLSVLILSLLFALASTKYCPEATKFSEVMGACLSR